MTVDPIVSAEFLKENLGNPEIQILSCHYDPKKDYVQEFRQLQHIVGAQHFDVEVASHQTETVRRELSTAGEFSDYVRKLGIRKQSHLILYDHNTNTGGLFGAARAWFLFKVYGHEKVSVLSGGIARCEALGIPLTKEISKPTPGNFEAKWNAEKHTLIYPQLVDALKNESIQVLDARPHEQFQSDNPQFSNASGNRIAKAINVPLSELLSENGALKSNEELVKLFEAKGVNLSLPIATICNSGMQSSGLFCVLRSLHVPNAKNFNGAYFQLQKVDPTLISEK